MSWKAFLTEDELKEVGIVACLDDKQRFLIIRRSNIDERAGMWTIPGGHIDESDSSIEYGASRELEEETDLVCLVENLIYLGEAKPKKYYFLTRKWSGDVDINIPNPKTGQVEHDDYRWATINEIKDITNSEIPIYLLEKALKLAGLDKNE